MIQMKELLNLNSQKRVMNLTIRKTVAQNQKTLRKMIRYLAIKRRKTIRNLKMMMLELKKRTET